VDDEQRISELLDKPLHRRLRGYFRMTGPGYMQSAMTLGGGSVAASVYFGSLAGYELLWVQPLSMLLGYFVMAAIAKQVCHTGERPYKVFWDRLSPILAVAWGLGALAATIIWHFPQYGLTANGVLSLSQGVGVDLDNTAGRVLVGGLILAGACLVVRMYHRGAEGVKHFENATKILVWTIVVAFALVAIATGIQWKRLLLGVTGISFIQDWLDGGIDPVLIKPIVAGMAAVTGINMFFLYSYALLNKGWGKKYKELAYFDLISGMAIPFIFATGFLVLAVANTIGPAEGMMGESVRDIRAIVPVLGPTFGQWLGSEAAGNGFALLLIGVGMIAIGVSTIVTHMLSCGFIGCEMFGYSKSDRARFWFSLMPIIAVVGVATKVPWQTAITASSLNAVLMPAAVLCFVVLLNKKSFMGSETPKGRMRVVWNVSLAVCLVVMSIAAWFGLQKNWQTLRERLQPEAQVAMPLQAPESSETMPVAP
jgi:manganese transport protein